jgi:hypothetical protein
LSETAPTFLARHAVVALSALITLLGTAWLGASSAVGAVTGTVTITTTFENTPISLNTSDAVGYALTNTTGATQTVSFTDALPPGVTLDNPVAATDTNGTGSCVLAASSAAPGSSLVTVTAVVPSETTPGSVCTISFSIVAGAPSNDQAVGDAYAAASSASGVVPSTTPGALTVLSNPTLSFSSPASNQSFYYGQIVDAAFACTATDPLDSIDNFFGTDDEGNQIESGAPIDTVDPGPHTLEVDCYSAAGGGDVAQSVSYSVGSYTLSAVRVLRGLDAVSFQTLVPAGRLVAEVIYGTKVIARASSSVTSRAKASVTVKPTAAGRRLLAATKGRSIPVKLQVTFHPQPIGSGDAEITPAAAAVVSRAMRLPLTHPLTGAHRASSHPG